MELSTLEVIELNCTQKELEEWARKEMGAEIFGEGQPISHYEIGQAFANIGIDVCHVIEHGKHKYIFELKYLQNRVMLFHVFLAAVRNQFEIKKHPMGGRPRDPLHNRISERMNNGESKQDAMRAEGLDPYSRDDIDKVDKAIKRRKD